MRKRDNSRIKWWNSGYNMREKADFVKYRLLHPKKGEHCCTDDYLKPGITIIDNTTPNFHIVFTGDFMPLNGRDLQITAPLNEFLHKSDLLVLNLEGVVTHKRRLLAQCHPVDTLNTIRERFPEKTVINVANNHAADFGEEAFREQIRHLHDFGFDTFGYDNTGYNTAHGIELHSATFWTNQPLDVVHRFRFDGPPDSNTLQAHPKQYNIFLPHWGYEMHLQPHSMQVAYARKLLQSGWDTIIGNHTHCPQPVEIFEGKVAAYSLGNFCYNNVNPNHSFGRVIRLGFALHEDISPKLSTVETYFTTQHHKPGAIEIGISQDMDYAAKREKLKRNARYWIDLFN